MPLPRVCSIVKSSRPLLAVCLGMLLGPAALGAQGWFEPRPLPRPLPAASSIEKLRTHVTVRVDGRLATVEVEEWFRNNGRGLGEGDYNYPLPAGAVFTSYSLYQGEQELRGELMDADRARSIYEAIVRAQRDPALIELLGKGLIRARVFPIEAGQTRRITLRYTQVLPRAGDALELRYAAGARHGTYGAGMAPLEFVLHVENGSSFRDAFSPTHDVASERRSGRMTVRPRQHLAGDFTVFLPLAEQAVGVTAAAHRTVTEDGFFMLTVVPGDVAVTRVPRDVTAVVDVSGSMSGEKMEQARRALHQLLGTLGPQDRLRLIAFSGQVRHWRAGWTSTEREHMSSARRWIDDLRADGGTNIHDALRAAFDAESPAARLPIIVFLTDGMPTVGETDVDRITAMAESRRGRARVFVLGVGFDVNTSLLDQLSVAARGTTQYVRPHEDVEQAVSLLARRVSHPVLTDLELNVAGVTIRDVYPRELPDLFAGEDLVIFGRYTGSGDARITVRGRRGGRAEQFGTAFRFPTAQQSGEYLTTLWAARRIGDLDRRIRAAQADGASRQQVAALTDELRETALRYGLLSEHTSYLVQEPGVLAAGTPRPAAAAAPFAVTGQQAVLRAEEARRAREVSSVADMTAVQNQTAQRLAQASAGPPSDSRGRRTVAGRTFVLSNGEWRDSPAAGNSTIVSIEPYSAAYFALLRSLPELTAVLRELDPVLVTGGRVSIRIAAGGRSALSAAEAARLAADFRSRPK
jgi:Ca-activated chloride channel homolog